MKNKIILLNVYMHEIPQFTKIIKTMFLSVKDTRKGRVKDNVSTLVNVDIKD